MDNPLVAFFGWLFAIALAVALLASLVVGSCWAYPTYTVWQQGKAGQAELKRAEQNRQIAIQEAQARLESAKFDSDAEIERARGVAEANRIIGDSLKDNDAYLRYLWINGLHNQHGEIIYVPTEAGLPILEAGRFSGGSARSP